MQQGCWETVNLNGRHLKQLASVDKKVSRGTPIIEYGNEALRKKGYDTSVLAIVTGTEELAKRHLNEVVVADDVIIGE